MKLGMIEYNVYLCKINNWVYTESSLYVFDPATFQRTSSSPKSTSLSTPLLGVNWLQIGAERCLPVAFINSIMMKSLSPEKIKTVGCCIYSVLIHL